MRKWLSPKPPGGRRAGRRRSGGCSTGRGDNPMGCGISGAATTSLVEKTGEKGRSVSPRPSLGRIPGRDANSHAVGRAGVAGRRQMPGPTRRDCPLRATEVMIYITYMPARWSSWRGLRFTAWRVSSSMGRWRRASGAKTRSTSRMRCGGVSHPLSGFSEPLRRPGVRDPVDRAVRQHGMSDPIDSNYPTADNLEGKLNR